MDAHEQLMRDFIADVEALADELGIERDQVAVSTFITPKVVGVTTHPAGKGRWTHAKVPYRPQKSNTYWIERLEEVKAHLVRLPDLPEATMSGAPGGRTAFRPLVRCARVAEDGSVWLDCGTGVVAAGPWDGMLGVWREATAQEWREAVGTSNPM